MDNTRPFTAILQVKLLLASNPQTRIGELVAAQSYCLHSLADSN